MKKTLPRLFTEPPARYRGKPFWAWNGKLDPVELRRQIGIMKRMGLGGFFMHARTGLATPYLGREWMDRVRTCIEEARRQGMEAWLYDEDRWPSGAAGGLVTRDPRFRERRLICEPFPSARYKPDPAALAAFATVFKDDRIAAYRRLGLQDRPHRGETVLVFRVQMAPDSDWYNGFGYLDTLNPAAVRRFIEVTHKAYAAEFGKDFGGVVPGIFSDEPKRGPCRIQGDPPWQFPWTDAFPRIFRKRYTWDLLDRLPELVFETEAEPVSQARWQYHDCCTALFVEAFARQIGSWCEHHGLLFTGHVLAEATPRSQTSVVGAAMRFYEYMQAPGIDILTEHRAEYDTARQCASVVRQTGRRWMLSELYGCTGWDFPFEGHKAVGDWQAALGVNLRCHHLYWHTMLGQAKRDYPASIGHPSPWWREYAHVEDYFARLGCVLSEGRPVRDLLVLHPIESTWTRYARGAAAEADLDGMDRSLARVRDMLQQGHIDFDYGDEEMLSRLAAVRRTRRGPRFAVGKAEYTAVLLPPMRTIRSTTLALLEAFADAGGRVAVAGEAPAWVDARSDGRAQALAARPDVVACPVTSTALLKAVEPARRLRLLDARGREARSLLGHLRDLGGKDLALFVCNTDRRKPADGVCIEIDGVRPGHAEEWDPVTGERYGAHTETAGDGIRIATSLPPSGSRLFLLGASAKPALPERPRFRPTRSRILTPTAWNVQCDEPNVLVMDMAAWRIGAKPWNPPTEILRIDSRCRDALGLPRRGGQMVQPWARGPSGGEASAPLALRFTFTAEDLPPGPIDLALEQPGRFTIALNGRSVDTVDDVGWWVDPSLRRIPLDPAAFRRGTNQLDLATRFERGHDLEAVFLLGGFGVRTRGRKAGLTARPSTLRPGDWTRQGFPFYGGAITYSTRITHAARAGEQLRLEVPQWAGTCARISVDGEAAGLLAWPPYEVDLTPFADRRRFELGITIVGHRRNSHGPLHIRPYPRGGWVGPHEYVTEGAAWSDDWQLVSMGLLAPPRLVCVKREGR